jgi:hypothetical protein
MEWMNRIANESVNMKEQWIKKCMEVAGLEPTIENLKHCFIANHPSEDRLYVNKELIGIWETNPQIKEANGNYTASFSYWIKDNHNI